MKIEVHLKKGYEVWKKLFDEDARNRAAMCDEQMTTCERKSAKIKSGTAPALQAPWKGCWPRILSTQIKKKQRKIQWHESNGQRWQGFEVPHLWLRGPPEARVSSEHGSCSSS